MSYFDKKREEGLLRSLQTAGQKLQRERELSDLLAETLKNCFGENHATMNARKAVLSVHAAMRKEK